MNAFTRYPGQKNGIFIFYEPLHHLTFTTTTHIIQPLNPKLVISSSSLNKRNFFSTTPFFLQLRHCELNRKLPA